mmetsp:Transcript_20826/g.66546  ORF Transcript_20826/g.66546 Transcript_20826/m.66546 type:complete len:294 (-) Transcript_20826:414-1295(-)
MGSVGSAPPSLSDAIALGVRPASSPHDAPASVAASSCSSIEAALAWSCSRAALSAAMALAMRRGSSSSSSSPPSAAACTMSVMSGTALSDAAIAFFHRAAVSGSLSSALRHLASAPLGAFLKSIASSRFAASSGSSRWPASASRMFSPARSLRYLARSASLPSSPLPSRFRLPAAPPSPSAAALLSPSAAALASPSAVRLKTRRAMASARILARRRALWASRPPPACRPSCGAYLAADDGNSPSGSASSWARRSAKQSTIASTMKGSSPSPLAAESSSARSSSARRARSFHEP